MTIFFVRLGIGAGIVFPFYLVFRLLYRRQKKEKLALLREILLCFFVLFMGGLVILVFWPGNSAGQSANPILRVTERLRTGRSMNLVPMDTIRSYFVDGMSTRFIINIVANTLMFSPIGFCLPLFWQRFQKWWQLLLVGLGFSVGIEITQLFIGRSVDIDDIFLNVAGVMLGYLAFILMRRFNAVNNLAQ